MTPPQNCARSSAVGLHRRRYWLIERHDPGCDAGAWAAADAGANQRAAAAATPLPLPPAKADS